MKYILVTMFCFVTLSYGNNRDNATALSEKKSISIEMQKINSFDKCLRASKNTDEMKLCSNILREK